MAYAVAAGRLEVWTRKQVRGMTSKKVGNLTPSDLQQPPWQVNMAEGLPRLCCCMVAPWVDQLSEQLGLLPSAGLLRLAGRRQESL